MNTFCCVNTNLRLPIIDFLRLDSDLFWMEQGFWVNLASTLTTYLKFEIIFEVICGVTAPMRNTVKDPLCTRFQFLNFSPYFLCKF